MSDKDLSLLTAADAAAKMASGNATSEELTRACLDRISAGEEIVGAFAHIDPDFAIAQARHCDSWRQSGKPIGPMHGVPVGIKDIIDTEDFPTECGTPLLSGRRPRRDATVVAKLREAGAVILGKTVTTEFAYFYPGKTKNPRDPSRTPGGSSSGSAAAVAAGMTPLAIGTQTNGSIIRPASFCGVYSMKPSHGLVSRTGALTLSRTLDHIGPFARSVEDLALVMDAIAGFDPSDPDTLPLGSKNFHQVAKEEVPLPPRLAFIKTPVWDKADASTREAFEELAKELGDSCFTYDLPEHYIEAWDALRAIMSTEMAHNLGSFVEKGGDKVSQQLRALVGEGEKVTAKRYLEAISTAGKMRTAMEELFQQECTAIITPSAKGVAPKGLDATGDPMFCTLWTLLGFPSVNLPILNGENDLPLGVQMIGAPGDDARLLRTANWLVNNL